MEKTNEINLIEQCKKNQRQAQETLYKLHSDNLFAICVRYCGNKENAKDCLQDSFVKIFTKIHLFKGGNFEAWIYTITVNTCLQFLKESRNKWSELTENTGQTVEIDDMEEKDFNESMNAIKTEILFSCITELPFQYRTVFNLYYMEEKTHKEISELLSISEGTSKSNLHKAKGKLRNLINEKVSVNYGK